MWPSINLDEAPNPALASKRSPWKETLILEPEIRQKPKTQESLPHGRDHPPADEREKSAAEWKAYSPETLLALDG